MKKLLTTIYSQPSIDEVKNLVNTFLRTFGHYEISFDDIFYCGVFCSSTTYANYDWQSLYESGVNFHIPFNLISPCSNLSERLNYVDMAIDEVIKGKITKPEWMQFIEMESSCGDECCDIQPSNFLRLFPKKEEYITLAEALIKYLYSPSRTKVCY